MVEGIWIAGCWQKWLLPRGNRRQVGGAGGGGSTGDTGGYCQAPGRALHKWKHFNERLRRMVADCP